MEIHIKSCSKLWEEREARKPIGERKPVPTAPVEIPVGKSMRNIDEHNAIVYEAYNTHVLVECPNCTRTFADDRLNVHLRSCTQDNPHRPPPSKNN